RGLDGLRELKGPLVVEREEVVRHPDVVVAELRDLPHLSHHRLDRARAEVAAENGLVAEVAAERTAPRGHKWCGRVLPVFAPVADVPLVGYIAAVWKRKVRHVLGPGLRRRVDSLRPASENRARRR